MTQTNRGIYREKRAAMLLKAAAAARENAYAPYSLFCVGAALLTENGKIYTGCNVENAAYSPACCAERTAFVKAISEGERSFVAIAVAGGKKGSPVLDLCPPCGVCRQFMREFCSDEFEIYLGKMTLAQPIEKNKSEGEWGGESEKENKTSAALNAAEKTAETAETAAVSSVVRYTLGELLPASFSLKNLGKEADKAFEIK